MPTLASSSPVLVTGSGGLLGSFLIGHLLALGYAVRGLYRRQIPEIPDKARVEWVEGDILDVLLLRQAMEGVHHVFHCAGVVSYAPQDEQLLERVNVEGTANVVNACLEAGHVKLCHVSSVAALGGVAGAKVLDEKTKWEASESQSAYARSKYYGELEVWRGVAEGLEAVIVNPSVVLGPGDWNRSSTRLFQYVHRQNAFYTAGEGNFVDVRDVAEIMTQLMFSEIHGERYILNQGAMPYKTFFALVAACWNLKPPAIRVPGPLAEVVWRVEHVRSLVTGRNPLITKATARLARHVRLFDNRKVKEALGVDFRPLPETIRWCCDNLPVARKEPASPR